MASGSPSGRVAFSAVGAVDWFTPGDETGATDLVAQHGHFVERPDRYAELRVPAGPSGRDFTFRRGGAGERGTVEWRRERYELTGLDAGVGEKGVEAAGPKWQTLRRDLQADVGDFHGPPRFDRDDPRYPLPAIDRQVPEALAKLDTPETIQAWASERWPQVEFDLAGGAPEVLRPLLAELDRLSEDWPSTAAAFRRIRLDPTLADDVIAWSETGELRLNPKHAGDWEFFRFRKVRMVEDNVYHSGAGSFSETMAHEFGHQLVYTVGASGDGEAIAELRDWLVRHRTADFTYNVEADETAFEAFAEGFAMRYHRGAEASHEAVVELLAMLDRWAERDFR